MATLSDKHKNFIVEQLAMYSTPQEVADLVKNQFGIELARSQVNNYDPTTSYYKGSKKWLEIYTTVRQKFLTETSSIAVANKAYRLRELDTIYKNQKSSKIQNTVAMKDTLEQAAKESGDAFTNRKEISGPNGKPVEFQSKTLDDWNKDADQRTAAAAAVLNIFDEAN